VSLCPEAWTRIVKLGGRPCHKLSMPGAAFLCVTSLAQAELDSIRSWAVEQGFLEPVEAWRGHYWDDEDEAWRWCDMPTREQAEAEVLSSSGADDLDEILEEHGSPEGRELVMRIGTWHLTAAGSARSPGMGNESATDAAIMLWVEDVARPAYPALVGLWWHEDYDPDRLSAPRGAILPSALPLFEVIRLRGRPNDEDLLDASPDPELVDLDLQQVFAPGR
jgi:hypothetical protein